MLKIVLEEVMHLMKLIIHETIIVINVSTLYNPQKMCA